MGLEQVIKSGKQTAWQEQSRLKTDLASVTLYEPLGQEDEKSDEDRNDSAGG